MIFIRTFSGTDVLDFGEYEYLQHLDYIINKLKEKYNVDVKSKLDGPGATLWKLSLNGFDYTLVNDDYGNFLRPDNEGSKEYLHQIFPLLEILFY